MSATRGLGSHHDVRRLPANIKTAIDRESLLFMATVQRLAADGGNYNLLSMKQTQHADAHLVLASPLRSCWPDRYRQQCCNHDWTFHRPPPLASVAAIMRAATSAANAPGRPWTRASNNTRGWSAGAITTASPSPGAFFVWLHGAVPVLAIAGMSGKSLCTAFDVPLRADMAIPLSTGPTASSLRLLASSK